MSGCTCSIDMDVGEGPECCTRKMQVSRKEHMCCECHRLIRIGEAYEYVSGLWDGFWSNQKTCAECVEIRDCYFCSYNFEQMWDAMDEEFRWGADWKVCILDKLSDSARRVMIEYLQEIIDEDDS